VSRFEFGKSIRKVIERSPGKRSAWRTLTVSPFPFGLDFRRSKIRESPQILIVARTLLKNTPFTVKEMIHLVAETVEVGNFFWSQIHLRNCSRFGVVWRASAFH
jgi:hypothetical protein